MNSVLNLLVYADSVQDGLAKPAEVDRSVASPIGLYWSRLVLLAVPET